VGTWHLSRPNQNNKGRGRTPKLFLTEGDSGLLWDVNDDFFETLHVPNPIEQRDEEVQTLGKGQD